jgi:predicted phosphohydrolase
MRIVAVADTHLYHGELVVPDGDVFVHAGDMCQSGHLSELATVAEWIASLPHKHKVIVAGNHDWAFVREPAAARALFSTMHYLEDAELALDGMRFYGSPWQPEFQGWAFNLPRGEPLATVWAKIPRGVDVLITHGPPHGMGDMIWDQHRIGCEQLRARVRQVAPRLHLFGHIHQDGGLWQDGPTTFANVTTWDCERPPTVIDVGDAIVPVVVPPSQTSR